MASANEAGTGELERTNAELHRARLVLLLVAQDRLPVADRQAQRLVQGEALVHLTCTVVLAMQAHAPADML